MLITTCEHLCGLIIEYKIQSSPSNRIPEATHSKTLRKDSPAPIGLSDVPMAFSTSSSRGYVQTRVHNHSTHTNQENKPHLVLTSSGWFIHNYILVQKQFSHPSWEWRPGRNTVTQVPHDPDHDNGRIQVVDFGLETQTKAGSFRGAASPPPCALWVSSKRLHK